MPRTEIDGEQILDGSVQKKDLDILTSGQSVITDVQVVGAGLSVTYTGADTGTGRVTIELNSGGFGTAYHPYSKDGIETTASNGWVQYDLVTTPIVPAGIYVIHFTADVTNSSKKTLGLQVNWRKGIEAWTEIHNTINPPALADVYETRASFHQAVLTADDTISIQINYGQTIQGGTASIRSHDVYLFKVAEL